MSRNDDMHSPDWDLIPTLEDDDAGELNPWIFVLIFVVCVLILAVI